MIQEILNLNINNGNDLNIQDKDNSIQLMKLSRNNYIAYLKLKNNVQYSGDFAIYSQNDEKINIKLLPT